MLIRKEHMGIRFENWLGQRIDVPLFVARVSKMVQGFVVGNLVIGVIMSAITVGVLVLLKVQGAVALGIASGVLNLVPFLGVVLATAVPAVAALMPAALRHIHFAADDGLHVALAGFVEKIGRGEQIAVIGDGHRRHLLA